MTLIIQDADALARFAESLAGEHCLAVDLEADSLHHYIDKVCLMQFSTAHRDVLLDPLAVRDLDPLKPILSDPGVRKVFHAGDYDLRCLWRDFGIEIRGIFDTMIASQLLGEEKIGLGDLLAKHFGVLVDKRFQKADWSRRPLPPEMVNYAVGDTRHLRRLSVILEKELTAKGRLSWAEEEFLIIEQVRFAEDSEDPPFLRVKGARTLERRGLAVLVELLGMREEKARQRDVPLFKTIGTETLLELARLCPTTREDLAGIGPSHRRVVQRHATDILAAVARGMRVPADQLPAFPRGERHLRDFDAERRLERLKVWRIKAAERHSISPGILINNALLLELAKRPPQAAEDLEGFPAMKRWQQRELGGEIIALLAKDSAPKDSPPTA
jgi:ribonuclease D